MQVLVLRLTTTGIVKQLLKATWNKKSILKLLWSKWKKQIKLNSMKSKISEALLNYEISHEGFTRIINEEKNYQELKESIRMIKKSNSEKNNLIEEGKRKDIEEIIRRSE